MEKQTQTRAEKKLVFLGGTCGANTNRCLIMIPYLKMHAPAAEIFNPQVEPGEWHSGLLEIEAQAKANASVNLFQITTETSSIASMIEAAELICTTPESIVLFIEDMVADNQIASIEAANANRGRRYLRDVAIRHGVHVYEDLTDALTETAHRLRAW